MDFSPGVIQREFNNSQRNASGGSLVAAFVGTAHKGPVNDPPLLSSPSEFLETFGEPTTQGGYAAINFLRRNGWLLYNRVVDDDAAYSTVTITAAVANIFTASGATYGTWGDDIDVVIAAADSADITECNIYVYFEDVLVERFTDVDSFTTLEALDSDYVTFAQVPAAVWPADWSADYASYALTGGDSGLSAVDMSPFFIGTVAVNPTTPATGLHVFDNKDDYVIDVVACPGMYDPDVVAAGLALAGATRQDCIYLVDPPDGLTAAEAAEWINGTYGGGPASTLNSSYGAAFYPYLTYADEYTGEDVYMAPSGIVAAIMANSWYIRNPYVAPAGRKRGYHEWISSLKFNPSEENIALTSSREGQNLNWFRNFPNYGIRLWTQKTLHRSADALDRMNVRVTLNLAQRRLRNLALGWIHEPTDEPTWSAIKTEAERVLDPIKAARGIRDYEVICDETTNTAAVRERHKIRAKIRFQPMMSAEWIVIDWIIVGQDVSL